MYICHLFWPSEPRIIEQGVLLLNECQNKVIHLRGEDQKMMPKVFDMKAVVCKPNVTI